MHAFLSILLGLIGLVLLGLLIFIGASIFLVRDLSRMRKEHEEGVFSVWYRRPTTRNSLKVIGYALVLMAGTVWWGWSAFLPSGLSDISELGMVCIVGSILLVIASSSLICDLRNLQGKRPEGRVFVWYRQSGILRRIGWIASLCGALVGVGCIEYVQLVQYFLHRLSYRILIPGSISSCLLISLSLFCYGRATFLQAKERRNRSYER